jgi:dihydrofolate synthase/folylpolyglutamate synthase
MHERIVVNQKPISEQALLTHLPNADEYTFFESMTFAAFTYFREEQIDVAIVETGLGGRWDATNVVTPILSVITSVSREHTALLGEDLENIAREKAGILKRGVPVVLGPNARRQSIYDQIKALECPLYPSKTISQFFDDENRAIAELGLQLLHSTFPIDTQALSAGLAARPSCRFEQIGDALFDVAHNPDAIFHLIQALHQFYPKKNFRFLAGFSKDKEFDLCLEQMAKVASQIHLVAAPSDRAASVESLASALAQETPSLGITHPTIREGVASAYCAARTAGELLVICGSFYIMAEAKEALFSSLDSS